MWTSCFLRFLERNQSNDCRVLVGRVFTLYLILSLYLIFFLFDLNDVCAFGEI